MQMNLGPAGLKAPEGIKNFVEEKVRFMLMFL
jgi:hypothetical protein